MRQCADSIDPASVPAGLPMYAGYLNGRWPSYHGIKQRFPDAVVLSISVNASNEGVVLDVENGDASPSQAPGWVAARRAAGVTPIVYCNASTWPEVEKQFAGLDSPLYWVANYSESPGTYLGQNNAVAHQYADVGPYDLSVFVDYIPGIDPAPVPSLPPTQENIMPVSPAIPYNGFQHVLQVSFRTLWHKWNDGVWHNEVVTSPEGGAAHFPLTLPDQTPQVALINNQLIVTVEDVSTRVFYFALSLNGTWGVNELP